MHPLQLHTDTLTQPCTVSCSGVATCPLPPCRVDRASAFKVLLAMESILSTVARGTDHSSLVDVVLNGPVGHVTPRKMGGWPWQRAWQGGCLH